MFHFIAVLVIILSVSSCNFIKDPLKKAKVESDLKTGGEQIAEDFIQSKGLPQIIEDGVGNSVKIVEDLLKKDDSSSTGGSSGS